MNPLNVLTSPAALSMAEAPDTYLLVMAGLIFLTSVAAAASVLLLLALAPLAQLALHITRSTRAAATLPTAAGKQSN